MVSLAAAKPRAISMTVGPDLRDLQLSALHEARKRLRAERLRLQHEFGSIIAERRALVDDLRATAQASRRRAEERAKGG
jgi:hypothetical protein